MKKLDIGESVGKDIIAKELWNETGIILEQGMIYDLVVSPKDQIWTDGKLFPQEATADGFSNWFLNMFGYLKRMKGQKWFALVGCIDRDEKTYVKIGSEKRNYSPPVTGQLVCFANDALNHYENNKGKMYLVVTRTA